jgi:hypothetical protein
MPLAGRAEPALTLQVYEPGGVPADSQVQSTFVPLPEPRATSVPPDDVIVTVQGCGAERSACTRIDVPSTSAFGPKIFSPPRSRAAAAIEFRRA